MYFKRVRSLFYFGITVLVFLLAVSIAVAQTCTGSLGDPIVNVNFDNGLGAGASTNYNYTNGTPNDGFYTIVSSTTGMFNTWWHVADHTGNLNGKMMVVNASVSKTDYFYKQTISGLCPGTTYEFAAWLLNLVKAGQILPNITFTVQTSAGTKSYSTGDIPNSPNGTFTQYGMFFTTPNTGGDVVLTITNNANGGVGNDIALDDITFRACGPNIISSFSTGTTITQLNGCEGTNQSYTLSANPSAGFNSPVYQWQQNTGTGWTNIPGATNTTYQLNMSPAVAGTYQYRLQASELTNIANPSCSVHSNVISVIIKPLPPANTATVISPVCQGEQLMLTASGGDTYSWTGPNGFSSNQQSPVINNVSLASSGTYQVVVTASGCSRTSTVNVVVNPKVTAAAGSDVTICKGNSTTLSASGGVTYQWSPAAGLSNSTTANPIATPAKTTKYTVIVSNSAGCSNTASVTVIVAEPPTANAGEDRKLIAGQSIMLTGTVTNAASYYWTPADYLSDPNVLNPTANPPTDITYTLHALPQASCDAEATDQLFVRVFKKVTIPNTFTPNGDGLNDKWVIDALETYPESITQVFDRYGRVLFDSKGYRYAWDGTVNGKALPTGTYYYKVDLKNGNVLSGWVALLR